MSAVAALIAATLNAGTPLLIVGIGILIHEKSGVLNLGIEGIMLMGAVAGFGVTFATGSFMLGFIAGGLVGVLLAAVFGFFTLVVLNIHNHKLTSTVFGQKHGFSNLAIFQHFIIIS